MLGFAVAELPKEKNRRKPKLSSDSILILKRFTCRILNSVHPAKLEKGAVNIEIMTVGPFEFFLPSDDPGEIFELCLIASSALELNDLSSFFVLPSGLIDVEVETARFERVDFHAASGSGKVEPSPRKSEGVVMVAAQGSGGLLVLEDLSLIHI